MRFSKYSSIYPILIKCRRDALNLKNEGYYDNIPGQLAIIKDIIKNPEKHYKYYQGHTDMFIYVENLIYNNHRVS